MKFKGYEVVRMLEEEEILNGSIIDITYKDDVITKVQVRYDGEIYYLYDLYERTELPSSYFSSNFCFEIN